MVQTEMVQGAVWVTRGEKSSLVKTLINKRIQFFCRWFICLNCYQLLILFALHYFRLQPTNRGEEPSMTACASIAMGMKKYPLILKPAKMHGGLPLRHPFLLLVFPRILFEVKMSLSPSPKVPKSHKWGERIRVRSFQSNRRNQLDRSRYLCQVGPKDQDSAESSQTHPSPRPILFTLKKDQQCHQFFGDIFMEMSSALREFQV